MFNSEFYPTPPALARQLAEPYLARAREGTITSILDPSAGKGDLLKPFHGTDATIYVMESSPELQALLRGETHKRYYARGPEPRYHLLASDCFEYQGRHRFDLILLNPPFSESLRHFDHAYSLLAAGGEIACILPSTDFAKDTKPRQLFASFLDRHEAVVTPCGSAFVDSERRTKVDVTIVRVRKPEAEAFSFGAGHKTNAPISFEADDLGNQIARNDKIGNLDQCFKSASEALADVSKSWQKAAFYLGALGVGMGDIVPLDHRATASPANLNGMLDAAQAKAWYRAVESSNVAHLFTGKMRETFAEYLASQGRMDFNAPNIHALFETLFNSRASISDQCVQDVFEKLCSYDAKNKIHVEGWKTNSAYKVNRKVIIPYLVVYDGGFRLSYHRDYTALDDIDKAMCHVTGQSFSQILTLQKAMEDRFKQLQSRDVQDITPGTESEFFKCRFYKKGTLHLEFKDKKVWELFNIAAARGRGWLEAA